MNTSAPELYYWQKDRHFRYLSCSEGYARAAGLDSPASIVGLSDDRLPWRSLADEFRRGDQSVIDGKTAGREAVQETEIMVDRVADILVTEIPLCDSAGRTIGVHGNFLDITGSEIVRKCGELVPERKRFALGPDFGEVELTYTELRVLRELLAGWNTPAIAKRLNKSPRTIEGTTDRIRSKLGCATRDEIVRVAFQSHFIWIVRDIKIAKI